MNIPNISLTKISPSLLQEEALVFLTFEGEKNIKRELARFFKKDDAEKLFSYLSKRKFEGKLKQVAYLPYSDDTMVIIIGLGAEAGFDFEQYRKAANASLGVLKQLNISTAALVPALAKKAKSNDVVFAVSEGILLGAYQFDRYKTKQKDAYALSEVHVALDSVTNTTEEAVVKATTICEGVYLARDLENEISDKITPATFADETRKIAKELKLGFHVIENVKKEGLGLLEAVGRGAEVSPRLVIIEYNGSKSKTVDVMLAGKGITFDTGGIQLKPSMGASLDQMHMDMGGAATVLSTIAVLARLKAKTHVVGVMALAENAIGQKSYKPGSVIKSYSGKTVEIANTDAEGRLVLADALAYGIEKYKPKQVIDIATLTGAVMVSLGFEAAGLFGNDAVMNQKLIASGARVHERLWELPLFSEFEEDTKSSVADLKNLGSRWGGRAAGSSVAAMFLKQFVGDTKWAHLDIAGTAILDMQRDYMPANGTGFGVRLLVEYLS